jgi:hypothetical protein
MAQADSVPSSSRQLITGESVYQSTNLPAKNLPAVTGSHRYPVGGSDARVLSRRDESPLLRLGRNKCGDEPEDRLKCRFYGANAGKTSMHSNIGVLFYVKGAIFLGWLLRRIVLALLLLVSKSKRLRDGAPDKVSSKQLVPSSKKERLR